MLEVLPRTNDHAVAEYHTVVLETPVDHAVAASKKKRQKVSSESADQIVVNYRTGAGPATTP